MATPTAPQHRRAGGSHPAFDASAFETSVFERRYGGQRARPLLWRRRLLVLFALLGCLSVFLVARQLAAVPHLDAHWTLGPGGRVQLRDTELPALRPHLGRTLLALSAPGLRPLPADPLLLHHSPRWQVSDELRQRQLRLHAELSTLLRQPLVELHFEDGSRVGLAPEPRGWGSLGWSFWPLAALALLLYLFAVLVLLARPRWQNLLYTTLALAQAGNLTLIALETSPGLGALVAPWLQVVLWRVALDAVAAAALVVAFAMRPHRLAAAPLIAAAAFAGALAWIGLVQAGALRPLWWWNQGFMLAFGLAALGTVHLSLRGEPNPYVRVMRRFAMAGVATLALVTLTVALAAWRPEAAPGVTVAASVAWYVFIAALTLVTPFLARSRQLLREFVMLAGVSTIAASLDLLFVAVFALAPFTSLAVAVFIALALYAFVRQYAMEHLTGGNSVPGAERSFELLYRAAREVQADPRRHLARQGQLLRELFEPLQVEPLDSAPAKSRVLGGGGLLAVPARSGDEVQGGWLLRYAQRGRRLFTRDDARLADRVLEQLRRAVAHDHAVERGRHEERLRIAQDLHDDIGARLLTLMYQAPTPEMEDYIRHTLQDLKTLTRGLAVAEQRLSHAAAEWKSDLGQRCTAAQVQLAWALEADADPRLSAAQWSALTRVLRELVSNALYHGHATRIEVALTLRRGDLLLRVADDGEGRAPQAWSAGLGLGGVRKRVKNLAGTVLWRENQPQGIVCEVRAPGFGGAAAAPAAPASA